MEPKDCDFLLMWNMPPFVADIINHVSYSNACHHCALALRDGQDRLLYIYDAYPPRVRRTLWFDYVDEMRRWTKSWQYRWGRDPLRCEVWRYPNVASSQRLHLVFEANAWLGVRYRLLREYLRGGPNIHCSEYTGRCLVASALASREDFVTRRNKIKAPNRYTPWDTIVAMTANGARVAGEINLL